MSKFKTAVILLLIVSLFFAALIFSGELLKPKYMSGVYDGAMIAEYYDEKYPHDVIFIGDCEVYENYSPALLWEKYGITSFIRGSANQLVWQSYYLLEETLEHETPQMVVFNVRALKNEAVNNEAYNRMTLDGMKLSKYKIASVRESLTEGESFISYLLPVFRYHSRWSELNGEDFEYLFKKDKVTVAGYLMNTDIVPLKTLPKKPDLDDYSLDSKCMEYLDKIRILCEDKGVTLVFVKSPCPFPFYYDEWNEQITAYAEEYGIDFYNFMECQDDIGIDLNTDSYDGGPHLNLYGAEKLTDYFGGILSRNYVFPDHSLDTELQTEWSEKLDLYNTLKKVR